jgi:lycopene beta-cyclase
MECDYAIAGGGLQGALIALAIRELKPAAQVLLIERGKTLGGNHLWSFHDGDLPAAARSIVEPLVVRRWPAYQVAFPDHARTVQDGYASVSSARLDAWGRARLEESILFGAEVRRLGASSIALADGRIVRARLVIDARGPLHLPAGACAYQKFAGVELRVPHAPPLPLLMDARVEQRDGFRFLYMLPLADDRVLVEDTRFSLWPELDERLVEKEALSWALSRGLRGEVLRRERGVLPLPIGAPPPLSDSAPLRAGYGGGFFHPVTGYSFPAALRLALHVATREPERVFDGAYRELTTGLRSQQKFGVLLNRLLYRAVEEADRWRVLSRFYRLPAPVIARFYALSSTRADRARILCGRPPRGVSLRRAVEALA